MKSWYRWRVNPGTHTGRRAARLPTIAISNTRTRGLKPHEMYSKKFYDSKIKPVVLSEIERLGGPGPIDAGTRLTITKRVTQELYDKEDDEVKEEVLLELERSKENSEKETTDPKARRQR